MSSSYSKFKKMQLSDYSQSIDTFLHQYSLLFSHFELT